MQALRHAKHHASLVLAWFVFSLGVAVASPLMQTQSFTLVCSDAGTIKRLADSDEGAPQRVGHTLDCPLCVQLLAPPLSAFQPFIPAETPPALAENMAAAPVTARRLAPFSARAPPASLSFC